VLGSGEMSSKIHRKEEPREAVGVHCICDGEYRVIEYTELDIYPQLLETDENGAPIHFAGNPAIHILSTPFVERVFDDYERFPWHRAHKKVPCLDEAGELRKPAEPNAFKFETFVFDALRFTRHEPIAVELRRLGEYTPIKQPEGKNSVAAAREAMNEYWGRWLEKAGYPVPRDAEGSVAINIEVSPEFALYEDEFLEKLPKRAWDRKGDIAIGPDGTLS
jgi:UDP-N-acetylglucosamine/UDP-N-acetylgalactosamine diphosphorylase